MRLQNYSKADQYLVQNLVWSGVYLRRKFSNAIIQEVLTFVPLTSTRPEVYVSAMTTFFSNSYNDLEETVNNLKSLKINSYLGENVSY